MNDVLIPFIPPEGAIQAGGPSFMLEILAVPQGLSDQEVAFHVQNVLFNAVSTGEANETHFELNHYVHGGMYEREFFLPAGHIVVGKIHKHAHLSKLVKGKIALFSEHDKGVFEAPYTFKSAPGAKRVLYAYEDAIFCTYHLAGEETDTDKLEDMIACELPEQMQQQLLTSTKFEVLP